MGSIIETITEVVIISRLHSITVMTLTTIKAIEQTTGGNNGEGKAETETPRSETGFLIHNSLPKCTMMMLGFDIDDKGECTS